MGFSANNFYKVEREIFYTGVTDVFTFSEQELMKSLFQNENLTSVIVSRIWRPKNLSNKKTLYLKCHR